MLSKESQVNQETTEFKEQEPLSEICEQNLSLAKELEQLETLLADGVKVPLTELIILDREQLLEKLDLIKTKLPLLLAHAQDILNNEREIIRSAESYAHNLIKSAEERAAQILSKSALVREAELEASKIMFRVHKECEQLRQKNQAEMEHLRETTLAECQTIQVGSDRYADAVLGNLEQELGNILAVIRNGRQQLNR
ncbi:MAG: DivIVA domain-containing protein [Xenococcaceae cyanobacterium MO_188.B32]|nr:DivIVA domain-containing protein [Xenococcaceae cyanobacterium MO_188.B32]